jgi:hypothetical protein
VLVRLANVTPTLTQLAHADDLANQQTTADLTADFALARQGRNSRLIFSIAMARALAPDRHFNSP